MRCALFALIAILSHFCGVSQAEAAGEEPPRLIATGWDSPTPAKFREHLSEFERGPFDGAVIRPTRRTADGRNLPCNYIFDAQDWAGSSIEPAIADLLAAKPNRATCNFLIVNANPGNVDWFDDNGWVQVVEHWRLVARMAQQGGMRGLLFDAEPYTEPHSQFRYTAQAGASMHTFAEYAERARARGRDVMRAVAEEFPDATIVNYRLLCDLLGVAAATGDPQPLLHDHGYGLMPAFLDGWLEVVPAGVIIVEGNENAYLYNSDADFHQAYTQLRTIALRLVAPENRDKYRRHVRIGHGLYMDAHVNGPESSWYIDRKGGTSASRLEANAAAALSCADAGAVVWVYGEKARWWDSDNTEFPMWTERLPGADLALALAADPSRVASSRLSTARAEDNRLANGDFAAQQPSGMPGDWWFWQDEKGPQGMAGWDSQVGLTLPGAGVLWNVQRGCLGQNVAVNPGELYAVEVQVRGEGKGGGSLTVRWKDAQGRWTALDKDLVMAPGASKTGQWSAARGLARVPDNAAELIVLLSAHGQSSETDRVWFDDARVVLVEGKSSR